MAGADEFGNDKWASEFNNNGEIKLNEYIKRVMNEYSRLLNINWKIRED